MSLEFAILGFLNHRPYSGYDLKKVFDTSIRHFWPADQSQIYRTLSRMNKSRWVDIEIIHQDARPDRKEYSITQAGRTAFIEWMKTPLPTEENRSADMIQVFFASNLSDEEAVEIFKRAEQNMRFGLAQYQQISKDPDSYTEYTKSPREFFFWMLTLEVGINMLESNLRFIESVIKRFENGEVPQA
ncbi:MAG: PadR family transcriptional regulator [Anaerolineaceae bacterium]|nr:PadR family transcriptional regulator [Anaerolineaceae bacterium]